MIKKEAYKGKPKRTSKDENFLKMNGNNEFNRFQFYSAIAVQ